LRVSADHPRWGVVNGEVKVNEEVVLHMLQPGALRGTLTENGKPPTPGKFTVALLRQRGNEVRGPLEQVPGFLTPGLDGSFTVALCSPAATRSTRSSRSTRCNRRAACSRSRRTCT
jgi:hypothetical protein